MMDAALLAMPDASGGVLWHPSSLQDIKELPPRVLELYLAYRAGQAQSASKSTRNGKQGTIGGKKVG